MAKCEKIVLVKIHTYVFMVEKNGLRCLFGGVLDLTGCGLARHAIFAVPHGPARHKNGPQARAWAEGQARRPMRHGPQGTACLLGPIAIVPCRPVTVPCRAGPARCPGMIGTLNLDAGQRANFLFLFFCCKRVSSEPDRQAAVSLFFKFIYNKNKII